MTTNDLQDIGPIDYLVVEFPGSRMTGEGLPLLVDLVDRGIIRILDFVFVKKELDGSVRGVAIADLDKDGQLDLTVFEGASSGLLAQEDLVSRPAACSSRAARPGSWSTRTAGRPPSPVPCGVAAARSSPAATSRSRTCSPRSTPPSPSSSSATARERKRHARTTSWGCTDGRDRRDGDGRVQPGVAAAGQPVGRPGAAGLRATGLRATGLRADAAL